MTFKEFMSLEVGDGVVADGHTGTVTKLTDVPKGEVKKELHMTTRALQAMRQMEISLYNERTERIEKLYPVIYTERPDDVHNRSVLARLQVWDPFGGM